MPKPLEEVAEVTETIKKEESEDIIYQNPSSLALLMSRTNEQRFESGKAFNGFVLEGFTFEENKVGKKNKKNLNRNNEFVEFVNILKENANNIPSGTRIELIVLNSAKLQHWLTVDLLIGKNGQVSSFVLDGITYTGYDEVYQTLKNNFPSGHHYVFESDRVQIGDTYVDRYIQTQSEGCDAFAIDHARQLSQIDNSVLYDKELAATAHKGIITPNDFKGGMKLTRIFRGMQTWTGLKSLPEKVRNTVIKESKQKTLEQYIDKHKGVSMVNGKFINETIEKKRKKNKENRRVYFESISPGMRINIMLNRQGFSFLKNPSLFDLNAALADKNSVHIKEFIHDAGNLIKKNITLDNQINKAIENLEKLSSSDKSISVSKNETLATFSAIFNHLDENNDDKNKKILSIIIRENLPFLKEQKPDEAKKIASNIAIISAIYTGNMEALKTVLPADDPIDRNSNTALHIAALSGNKEVLNSLIRYYDNPDLQNARGETPLYLAALNGDNELVHSLYKDHGADPNMINNNGDSLIHLAIKVDRNDVIDLLHEQCDVDLNQVNKNGLTPLMLAAKEGNYAAAETLIDKQAEVNVDKKNVVSPFVLAARNGHRKIVNLLLDNDAKVKFRDDETGNTLLHEQAIISNTKIFSRILKNTKNPNELNNNSESPLMIAMKMNSYDAVQILLEDESIDITIPENIPETLLRWVSQQDDTSIMSVIYDKLYEKFDDTLPQFISDLPVDLDHIKPMLLYYAANQNHSHVVASLTQQHVPVIPIGMDNETAFHAALNSSSFTGCDIDIIRYLTLSRNIEDAINLTDQNKQTPLHLAVGQSRWDIVSVLLEHDAKVNELDINYTSPLGLAIASYHDQDDEDKKSNLENIIIALIQHGSDPNIDRASSSLLSIAISNNMNLNIIAALLNGGAYTWDMFDTDKNDLLKKAVSDKNGDVTMHMLINLSSIPKGYVSKLDISILKDKFIEFVTNFKTRFPEKSEELQIYLSKMQNNNSALAKVFDQPLSSTPLAKMATFSHPESHSKKVSEIIAEELAKKGINTQEAQKEQKTLRDGLHH